MPDIRVFEDNGRAIRVVQDHGRADFFVTGPEDIWTVLHYVKWHPEVRRDTFKMHRVTEIDEEDATFQKYVPKEDASHNYIVLAEGRQHPLFDILREYSLFVDMKEEKFGGLIPRDTVIKQTDRELFDWDYARRLHQDAPGRSQAFYSLIPQNRIHIFAGKDTSEEHQRHLLYLDSLPDANIERLVTL
jgi:hypothetical protein